MFECYGWFDDFDECCWLDCPYSCECEYYTYEYDVDLYLDDYYWY